MVQHPPEKATRWYRGTSRRRKPQPAGAAAAPRYVPVVESHQPRAFFSGPDFAAHDAGGWSVSFAPGVTGGCYRTEAEALAAAAADLAAHGWTQDRGEAEQQAQAAASDRNAQRRRRKLRPA